MIGTENRITIDAPTEVIFALAQDVGRWPQLLKHYRYVDVLRDEAGGRRRLVRMGARRGRIPVGWVAEQECSPEAGTIAYRHVAGITRGMQVEWRITPGREGCSVSIMHELNRPEGLLRLPLGSWIAGRWFIAPIADRTLHGIKLNAEAAAGSRAAPAQMS